MMRHRRPTARRLLGLFACVLAGFAFVAVAVHLLPSKTAAASEDPATVRHIFSETIANNYDFRFGTGKPFLPSNAMTETGEFLDPKTFPNAAYCGHCHQEAHKQWRQSAHANSFRAPWYKKNVNLLMSTKGNEYAR